MVWPIKRKKKKKSIFSFNFFFLPVRNEKLTQERLTMKWNLYLPRSVRCQIKLAPKKIERFDFKHFSSPPPLLSKKWFVKLGDHCLGSEPINFDSGSNLFYPSLQSVQSSFLLVSLFQVLRFSFKLKSQYSWVLGCHNELMVFSRYKMLKSVQTSHRDLEDLSIKLEWESGDKLLWPFISQLKIGKVQIRKFGVKSKIFLLYKMVLDYGNRSDDICLVLQSVEQALHSLWFALSEFYNIHESNSHNYFWSWDSLAKKSLLLPIADWPGILK